MTLQQKIAVPGVVVALIAQACHEANREYCESIGDSSQKPWAEAPDWQQASAIAGVEFHIANPEATDSASHEEWMKHKLADGWKKGDVKDERKKTHPCLVPFSELPPEQQEKDRIFKRTVHQYLEQYSLLDLMAVTLVKAYLDANLADAVKQCLPETDEEKTARERLSYEETVAKRTEAAAAKAKREAKAREKAEAEAAKVQERLDAKAAKAFENAEVFTGDLADITDKIVRGIRIDNGSSFSADHEIPVRFSELEPTPDGNALVLTKPIELPARGREFAVLGVSLLTDAGIMRIALNGRRKCGGGNAVSFPARSLMFRPGRKAETGAE